MKVTKASLFYLPSTGACSEIQDGTAATRSELYPGCAGSIVRAYRARGRLRVRLSFTKHHFHIEGFGVSSNPALLDLYFAMPTKRIRMGQLGIVLLASNPIRVAEDIAMLGHMTGGRSNAGFAK